MRTLLTRAGFVVGKARDFPEAEEQPCDPRPDLAIVDVRLPGRRG
jgi:DNA-binding response OmpR family regulator